MIDYNDLKPKDRITVLLHCRNVSCDLSFQKPTILKCYVQAFCTTSGIVKDILIRVQYPKRYRGKKHYLCVNQNVERVSWKYIGKWK